MILAQIVQQLVSVFDKIVNGNYDYSTDQLKGKYISNNVALEIFRLTKKKIDYKFSDKVVVISFLSGKERSNDDTCNKTLFTRLNSLKKSNEKNCCARKRGFKDFLGETI